MARFVVPSDLDMTTPVSDNASHVAESVLAGLRSAPESETPTDRLPPARRGEPRGSWRLKVAVILVVAALCIAFAGLLWALIF